MGSTTQQTREPNPVRYEDIDRTCRWPVLYLFGKATGWLVISLVLGLVSSIKMHAPDFWSDCAWVTYGRIRPAFFNAFLYGFAIQASLGMGLWMMARLGRTQLVGGGLALIGAVVWNLAVAVGVLQVMGGQTTGFTWMEMPREAAALLAGGFFLIAVTAFSTLKHREERRLYISQRFLVAALLAFLWILIQGYFMGVLTPVRGVVQAVVSAWFASGMQYLVLIPFGLAVAYYLLPKLSGKPVYSNQAAVLGFWMLILFGGGSALSRLPQGPLPRWMLATGASCKFMLVMVVACFAVNWIMTLHRGRRPSSSQPAWTFLVYGAWGLMTGLLLDVLGATHSLLSIVAFTTYSIGVTHLIWLGFLMMVLFAGIYYVTERLLGEEWNSRGQIRLHLVLTVFGTFLVTGAYILGGLVIGPTLNHSNRAFVDVARSLTPFLGIASLGYTLLLAGQVVLSWNFVRTVLSATSEARTALSTWCCGEVQSGKKARAGV